jgi:hypothetical protein
MKRGVTTTLRFVNADICIEGDSNESKNSYGPLLHSHTWMPYSQEGTQCVLRATNSLWTIEYSFHQMVQSSNEARWKRSVKSLASFSKWHNCFLRWPQHHRHYHHHHHNHHRCCRVITRTGHILNTVEFFTEIREVAQNIYTIRVI